MQTYQGKKIVKGIAAGRLKYYSRQRHRVKRIDVEDPEEQIRRFHDARKQARESLKALYDTAMSEVGRSGSAIFEAYQILLADQEYIDAVCDNIRKNKVNAEYAISKTSAVLEKLFSSFEDDYIRARAQDVRDISDRLIEVLSGDAVSAEPLLLTEPVILFCEGISPSELIQIDKSNLAGLVTLSGSSNSHTAILARSMGIPMLSGIDLQPTEDGKKAVLDTSEGTLIIDPSTALFGEVEQKQQQLQQEALLLAEMKGLETVTLDGKKLDLFANISSVKGAERAMQADAEGIGLFRTEFLYLESDREPSEEQQFEVYKTVAKTMEGRIVIIRTLDIGADKQAPYLKLPKEDNPAMGMRGIRLCLQWPDLFETQLRAILRAACFGKVAILLPMIISPDEILQVKSHIERAKSDLKKAGCDFREVPLGVMIETPAAVMISDLLAQEADFLSIGTNDLTQYALAVDRQNPELDNLIDPHHEAVFRMIRLTVENGHKHGCKVGICGELASDPALTETFLRMGVDELSVSSSMILPLRRQIRQIRLTNETA